MHTVDSPCSMRSLDDTYWLFWRSPGTPEVDFSQNLNDMEQPLALSNRRFPQSVYAYGQASLQQAVSGRRLFAVLEVPKHSGGRFFSKSQRYGTTAGPEQSSFPTERICIRTSVPAAGGVWTTLICCSGGPQALRRSSFLKISTIWNNRWP
jgi:hypothetical protein